MSADTTPQPQAASAPPVPPQPSPAPAPTWKPLSVLDRRILGVLVEKQKTSKSADAYPLTLNALVTGCNQKSNRDPILELDEVEVEDGIEALQPRGLVSRVTGGRADRFRHELYTAWTDNGAELAVLAELLLRGPQTKGDLRTRAARMSPIDSLDALEDVLKPLAARRLVVYLTEPDRRGAVVTHGFHAADELARLKAHHAGAAAALAEADAPARAPAAGPADGRLATALAEIDALKARVAALEAQLADVRARLNPPAG
jgi:uncharacterized protein YceH (UPF0502 family)